MFDRSKKSERVEQSAQRLGSIPQPLKDDPWPVESDLPQRSIDDFRPANRRNKDQFPAPIQDPDQFPDSVDTEPVNQVDIDKLAKIITEKHLDRIADLFLELTFGEMKELAEQIGMVDSRLPGDMELALTLHKWGERRQNGDKFEKQPDEKAQEIIAVKPKNGRKPKPDNGHAEVKGEADKVEEDEP
jgi:hypothetical protein